MLLAESLLGSSSTAANYIEDVFSTYLYTGDGTGSKTITNGIDLAGKGGMVWTKSRSDAEWHILADTVAGRALYPNASNGASGSYTYLAATYSTGYATDGASQSNLNGSAYVSWTFRKQAKFFDIVTYTGTGANRTIAHNLGSAPGCIIIKRLDAAFNWQVYHRSLLNTQYLELNTTTAPQTNSDRWNSTTPTATVFSLGTSAAVNANGGSYVAYLFAHNAGGFGASSLDNVISCGSFTTDGAGDATITLGYEPQWILFKGSGNWYICDVTRGMSLGTAGNSQVYPNLADSELTDSGLFPTSTGFAVTDGIAGGTTYYYIAIRRGPMKTPTVGTSVFNPVVYTGTNVDARLVNTTISPDMVFVRQRNDTVLAGMVVGDRLRGRPYLLTGSTNAEVNDADAFDEQLVGGLEFGGSFSSMSGFWCGNDPTAKLNINTTSNNHIAEAFKRAPGFFDIVGYTGSFSALTLSHNLGVVPELMMVKRRNTAGSNWIVYSAATGATKYLVLDGNNAAATFSVWNDTAPTASVFSVGTDVSVNNNGDRYVWYGFASVAGVSKVGSYTGSGTTKQIDCGFTGGARFVLIKRTDSTGDWYVWDSARGIVAGNDPYLLLNSTAAEVTSTDYIDTYSAGFEISSTAPAAINANGGSFVYLAIA